MKKLLVPFLVVIALLLCCGVAYAATTTTTSDIKVTLDGQELTFAAGEAGPVVKDDRVLVPMRKIFEAMDIFVNYENGAINTQHMFYDLPTCTKMQLGSTQAEVHGSYNVTMDVSPQVINGSTYVPLRFVSEASYADVVWHGDTKTVEITRQDIKTISEYIDEVFPKELYVGDQTVMIDDVVCIGNSYDYMWSTSYPKLIIDINNKEDIDTLINAGMAGGRMLVAQVLGQLAYDFGQYYQCDVVLEIQSEQYGEYDAELDHFFEDTLLKTTYDVNDTVTGTIWFN